MALEIKKNGTTVVSLSDDGNITFTSYYEEENAPAGPIAGGLLVKGPNGNALLGGRDVALPNATITDVWMRGRFSADAIIPAAGGLRITSPQGVVAVVTNQGDLLASGHDQTAPPDPGVDGPFQRDRVVYARPGLVYPGGLTAEYSVFAPSSAHYQTLPKDISDFSAVSTLAGGNPYYAWPFTAANVPINGIAYIPQGNGPFPVILFAHGNHTPLENSTPGYEYLCDLLASHGIIAATIDVNFLNGAISGENAARAIVQLEHVRQFRDWNALGGHPLQGKVDMSRVVIVGHSRGGEAVGHASLFNRLDGVVVLPAEPLIPIDGSGPRPLGPYHFDLRGVVAIAPTDGQYKPVEPLLPYRQSLTVVEQTSYFLIHGAMDADVVSFPGYLCYDRALPYDVGDMTRPASGYKSLVWAYGANHNYFNTVWGYDHGQTPPQLGLMTAAEQQEIAKVYIGGWAQIFLLARSPYWRMFREPGFSITKGWVTGVTLASQYHDKHRVWLQTFDNVGAIQLTAPVTGNVVLVNGTFNQLYLNRGPQSFLYQETGALRGAWAVAGETYEVNTLAFPPEAARSQVLSLRVGQSIEGANPANTAQDFTIRVKQGGNTFTAPATNYAAIPYPAALSNPPATIPVNYARKTVMQTIRIPLRDLEAAGLDVRAIDTVEFVFDRTNAGALYFDDLQLTL